MSSKQFLQVLAGAVVIASMTGYPSAFASMSEVSIDLTTGATSITFFGPTTMDGYEITAPTADSWNFSDNRWSSLVDQAMVSGWSEFGGGTLLSEANFLGSPLSIPASTTLDLGTPYVGSSSASANGFAFRYTPDGSDPDAWEQGSVVLIPEPATMALMGLGAVAMWRRR